MQAFPLCAVYGCRSIPTLARSQPYYRPCKFSMSEDTTELLDTQIISYALKGLPDLSVTGKAISAITANEFLLVQSINPAQANYYVPLLSKIHFPESTDGIGPTSARLNRDHPFRKMITDQVRLEFGNEFPTIIEYGNLAIAMLINKRISALFDEAIKFLDKAQKKTIRRRFRFLLENEITCFPLSKNAISIGMELLQAFSTKHKLKANFRNSLNDILVFATAIDASAKLVTADALFSEFAAKHFEAHSSRQEDIITVDFREILRPASTRSTESKGYINKGWQVSFRNYHWGVG